MVCIHIQYFFGVVWSSNWRCSLTKGVLKNFTKSTGKHQCQILFFNKVAGLRSATLLKKRLCHRCFPVNFANFLRTPLVQNTSGRQLLWATASETSNTKEDQKFKKRMLCECALNFDQWKTFSKNYSSKESILQAKNSRVYLCEERNCWYRHPVLQIKDFQLVGQRAEGLMSILMLQLV